MDFSDYSNFLVSLSAHGRSDQVCAICLCSLNEPAEVENERYWFGEHRTATCRLPCGHSFHSACISEYLMTRVPQWLTNEQGNCPCCRADIYPEYPYCYHCNEQISPAEPVVTFPESLERMHLSCANHHLMALNMSGGEEHWQEDDEEIRMLDAATPLDDSPASPSYAELFPLSASGNGYSLDSPTYIPSSPAPSVVELEDDDEVVVIGEVTRVFVAE